MTTTYSAYWWRSKCRIMTSLEALQIRHREASAHRAWMAGTPDLRQGLYYSFQRNSSGRGTGLLTAHCPTFPPALRPSPDAAAALTLVTAAFTPFSTGSAGGRRTNAKADRCLTEGRSGYRAYTGSAAWLEHPIAAEQISVPHTDDDHPLLKPAMTFVAPAAGLGTATDNRDHLSRQGHWRVERFERGQMAGDRLPALLPHHNPSAGIDG